MNLETNEIHVDENITNNIKKNAQNKLTNVTINAVEYNIQQLNQGRYSFEGSGKSGWLLMYYKVDKLN